MSLHVESPTTAASAASPRRAHRAAVIAFGVVTALGLATALTLPIVLDDRSANATEDLQKQLQLVADAQVSWKAEHGSYTTSLDALGVQGAETDLAIVQAGDEDFCVGGYDDGTRTSLFYSSGGGLNEIGCD